MSTELICSALDLRPDQWPPDHYALLGLPPGDVDAATVEARVLDRMERLRRYQLAHPDAVTDAMNRLAQALVCLTDPAAKAAYDAGLPALGGDPQAGTPTQPRSPGHAEEDESPGPYLLAPPVVIAPAPSVRPPTPPPPPPRRPDGRRDWYHRLAAARHLLAAWRDVGPFVDDPNHRMTRPAEAVEFVGALLELRGRLADETAPAIGVPGQPGALLAALARQPLPLSTFRHFLPDQRAALAADWRAGEARLAEAYRGLERAARRHRLRAPHRAVRKVARSLVTDRLDVTMLVLGLAALALAILRTR